MKTIDFDYHLPEELIANYPMHERSSSRLLVSKGCLSHRKFKDIIEFIDEGTSQKCVIFNSPADDNLQEKQEFIEFEIIMNTSNAKSGRNIPTRLTVQDD